MINEILIDIAIIMVAVFVLVKAADLITDTSVHLARRLGIGEFLIGFMIMGVLTTLPEISVAINSIYNKVPDLTLGNLLGASLVLITLIIGLNAFVRKQIPFHGRFNSRELLHTLVVIVLPVLTILDQDLTVGEGLLLLVLYASLIIHLQRIFHNRHIAKTHKSISRKSWLIIIVEIAAGIAGLVLMSDLIIDKAIALANLLNINIALIGIFLLSVGTNLPELTILFRAKNDREEQLAVGNFLGSATVNTAVIGIIGVLNPHHIAGFVDLLPVMLLLVFAVCLFFYLERSHSALNRKQGLILIAVYVVMILSEIITKLFAK